MEGRVNLSSVSKEFQGLTIVLYFIWLQDIGMFRRHRMKVMAGEKRSGSV